MEKLNILNEQYKDVLQKENQIKLTKNEFFSILKDELDIIICNQKNSIKSLAKPITTEEIKYDLTYKYNQLNMNNFDLIFFTREGNYNTFGNKEFQPLVKISNDFVLIILDKKNEEGKTAMAILEENEKKKNNEIINQETNTGDNTDILSKEELKKLKEEQKRERKT